MLTVLVVHMVVKYLQMTRAEHLQTSRIHTSMLEAERWCSWRVVAPAIAIARTHRRKVVHSCSKVGAIEQRLSVTASLTLLYAALHLPVLVAGHQPGAGYTAPPKSLDLRRVPTPATQRNSPGNLRSGRRSQESRKR